MGHNVFMIKGIKTYILRTELTRYSEHFKSMIFVRTLMEFNSHLLTEELHILSASKNIINIYSLKSNNYFDKYIN